MGVREWIQIPYHPSKVRDSLFVPNGRGSINIRLVNVAATGRTHRTACSVWASADQDDRSLRGLAP